MTEAVARRGDPDTSWEAARSVADINAKQRLVYLTLAMGGMLTDEVLASRIPSQSPSGVRTRRSELVAMGLVRDTGKRGRTASGRSAIIWEVAP